ncbi:MAG: DUF2721 domain-containing protein [Bacteroidetes bacterium]|nr:DUF2721 domain-containing protein [Bacteroidota bacterium]
MIPEYSNDIATAIQLALAPVFLLTAIAGMLGVMAGRLSRIIDRGRFLTEGGHTAKFPELEVAEEELHILEKRRHFTSVAITAFTIAALLVCLVITTLFLEVMFSAPLQWAIGLLFSAATLVLVIGLTFFLREVHLATTTIRIRKPQP